MIPSVPTKSGPVDNTSDSDKGKGTAAVPAAVASGGSGDVSTLFLPLVTSP